MRFCPVRVSELDILYLILLPAIYNGFVLIFNYSTITDSGLSETNLLFKNDDIAEPNNRTHDLCNFDCTMYICISRKLNRDKLAK